MITAVDTCVLLDVLTDDPAHALQSEALSGQAYQQGSLIICPVDYAEIAPSARDRRQLDEWMQRGCMRVVALTAEQGHAARLAHAANRKAGVHGRFSDRRSRPARSEPAADPRPWFLPKLFHGTGNAPGIKRCRYALEEVVEARVDDARLAAALGGIRHAHL